MQALLKDNKITLGIIALYIAINAFFTFQEFYWFNVLPGVLIIGVLGLMSLNLLFQIIIFSVPLSVNLDKLEFGLGISLPSEPLIAMAMFLFLARSAFSSGINKNIINHPISLAVIFHLAWIAMTTVTSEMPVVSIKFLLSRLWFVVVFYYLALNLFLIENKNMHRFIWLYIISFILVIGYTIVNHSLNGFEKDPAHWVMTPFYNDHTSYGAILAMYIPVIFYYFRNEYSQVQRLFVALVLIIFLVAIVLSYTRAAWVSLIGALGIYVILFFRIKFTYLFAVASFLLILFFSFRSEIIMKLEKNTQDSSQDLGEHVQSISNISSDASNLERINRWNSAIRMFKERPVFGWGPGTYMFQYAPFQSSEDLTTISTNGADLGNAHSEYIGPLAEQGIGGPLAFIIILIVVFYTGVRFYQKSSNQAARKLVLVSMLALSTYYIHGLLNNFLDTDKASAPFWGFIAIITALDIQAKRKIE